MPHSNERQKQAKHFEWRRKNFEDNTNPVKDLFAFRVGNFNVLNLVREDCVFYGKEKYTKAQVDKKVEWIAQQLKRMHAGMTTCQFSLLILFIYFRYCWF